MDPRIDKKLDGITCKLDGSHSLKISEEQPLQTEIPASVQHLVFTD
jgi:hypothetical protein